MLDSFAKRSRSSFRQQASYTNPAVMIGWYRTVAGNSCQTSFPALDVSYWLVSSTPAAFKSLVLQIADWIWKLRKHTKKWLYVPKKTPKTWQALMMDEDWKENKKYTYLHQPRKSNVSKRCCTPSFPHHWGNGAWRKLLTFFGKVIAFPPDLIDVLYNI